MSVSPRESGYNGASKNVFSLNKLRILRLTDNHKIVLTSLFDFRLGPQERSYQVYLYIIIVSKNIFKDYFIIEENVF